MNANAQQTFRKTMSGAAPAKKRLTGLSIHEISAVTSPANEHARATILKSAGPTPLSFATLDDAISFLTKSGASRLDAYRKAGSMYPELVSKLNDQPSPRPTRTITKADDAMRSLDMAATALRAADPKLSRTEAMEKARREHPDLYAATR
jgi:hypothetical protein